MTVCFLDEDWDNDYHYGNLNINHYCLITQYSLNAIGCMFYYTAIYEFICSQSPHAMKGLVIGTFFAIKGIFQLLGVLITYIPFVTHEWTIARTLPSCGFVYYLINAIIALIGIVAYTCCSAVPVSRER